MPSHIFHLLVDAANDSPDASIIFDNLDPSNSPKEFSYLELLEKAKGNAQYVKKQHDTRRGPVLVHFNEHAENVEWFWSVLAAGLTPAISNPLSHSQEDRDKYLRHIRATLDISMVITSEAHRQHFQVLERLGVKVISIEHLRAVMPENGNVIKSDTVLPTQGPIAFFMFTSGSTGAAKAVGLTHDMVASSISGKSIANRTSKADVFLNWIGFDHVACVMEIHLLATLTSSRQVFIPSGGTVAKPLKFFECAAKYRVTYSFAPNFFLTAICNALDADPGAQYDLRCLRKVVSGGEANVVSTGLRFNACVEKFGGPKNVLTMAYGLTETGGGCIYHDDFPATELQQQLIFTSVGQPIKTVLMRLVGGDGQPVNRHSEGLLELSGPVVFSGYANNEKATKDVFSGKWFATGDKGYLDSKERLILRGRAKDTIIINGTNFFSHEIESMIKGANITGVELSHVVVIPTWNAEKGTEEAVVLFQPTTDAYEQRRLLLSAARKIANAVVKLCARYPNEIIPLPSRYFQKSSLGKILRQKLKLQYDQGEFDKFRLGEEKIVTAEPEQEHLREGPALQQLRSVWSEVLGKPESLIRTDDNFFDLGGDSIKVIRLISELQAHGLSLKADEVFETPYLGAMSSRCQKHEGEKIQNTRRSVPKFSATEHAQYLNIPIDAIESVSHCSPVQEGLVASSVKEKGHNIVHQKYVVDLEDFQSWSDAWAEVIGRHPILRTRFYASPEGLLQVVTNVETPRFSEFSSRVELEQYLESLELTFGGETVWFSLERDETANQIVFVWSCHHAVIDGWSAKLILDDLSTLLTGGHVSTTNSYAAFDGFIDYTRKINKEQAETFWRDRLQDVEIPRLTFFKEPGLRKTGKLDTFHMDTSVDISVLRGSSVTITSILKGAFGFILARHMGCEEVCFGSTTSGRMAPVGGIHSLAAPTIATIPTVVKVDMGASCISWLKDIQKSTLEAVPYEQIGLHQIAKVCDTAQYLCDFPCILDIQPASARVTRFPTGKAAACLVESQTKTEYPLLVTANFDEEKLDVELTYYQGLIEIDELNLIVSHLRQAVESMVAIVAKGQEDVNQISVMGAVDHGHLQKWKEQESEVIKKQPTNCTVDGLLMLKVLQSSDQIAIDAWDGTLTYKELHLSSSALAEHLVQLGADTGSLIPIMLEKSRWAVVTMLAIWKSGAAYVPLDPTQPLDRLLGLLKQIKPKIVIGGPITNRVSDIDSELPDTKIVDIATLPTNNQLASSASFDSLSTPTNVAYVLFTSGSTGTPKGVVIEHQSLCVSLLHLRDQLNMPERSKMLQFSAFIWDVHAAEIWGGLISGATVCIPSEQERQGNLEEYMTSADIEIAYLTPTVSSVVDPNRVSALKKIIFVGEALTGEVITKWSQAHNGAIDVLNGYGPTETGFCSLHPGPMRSQGQENNIGTGLGTSLWVVNPANINELAPVGCPGELLVAGTCVARGYLNDEARTTERFLRGLPWMHDWINESRSDFRRIYKTGDIVRYNLDGTLTYLGRKDTQTKVNGQRIEPGEIEHHVRLGMASLDLTSNRSETAVLIVQPQAMSSHKVLAAFLSTNLDLQSKAIAGVIREIRKYLESVLPRYMVPNIFIPVDKISTTATGKVDRRKLERFALTLSVDELTRFSGAADTASGRPVRTDEEKQLEELWRAVLQSPPSQFISAEDNFFELGGDSVLCMKLMSLANKKGLRLGIQDIWEFPVLEQMAQHVQREVSIPIQDAGAFYLMAGWGEEKKQELIMQAASTCGTNPEEIEDILPCTSMQEALLSLSSMQDGTYIASIVLQLPPTIDLERLRNAVQSVIQTHQILRTRFTWHREHGMLQVVLKSSQVKSQLQPEADLGPSISVDFGSDLSLVYFVKNESGLYLKWTLHHALYDGWSMNLIMRDIENAYFGEPVRERPSPRPFIHYISSVAAIDQSKTYWTSELAGATPTLFPPLSHPAQLFRTNESVNEMFSLPVQASQTTGITFPTILRAAWALVISRLTGLSDVIFGCVLTGRNVNLPEIDELAYPTMSSVPVRIALNEGESVQHYLWRVQEHTQKMMPHETYGLQNIRRLNPSAFEPTGFRNMLVIQSKNIVSASKRGLLSFAEVAADQTKFEWDVALGVECRYSAAEVEVKATFDNRVLEVASVRFVLRHFQNVIQQLYQCAKNEDRAMGDLSISENGDHEYLQIWRGQEGDAIQIQETKPVVNSLSPFINEGIDPLNERQAYELSVFLAERIAQDTESKKAIIGKNVVLSRLIFDSIQMMSFTYELRKRYATSLNSYTIFQSNMTLRELAGLLVLPASIPDIPRNGVDLIQQVELLESSLASTSTQKGRLQPLDKLHSVFLTGATGILGTQILRQLLETPFIQKVIVLVRAKDAAEAVARVIRSAKIGLWWVDSYLDRLEVWEGDLSLPKLGLSQGLWERLTCRPSDPNAIGAIIHNGASVDWSADYESLKGVNVTSTFDLLTAAISSPSRMRFVFISGGSLPLSGETDKERAVRLASGVGYSQTKFVSELLVKRCAERLGSSDSNGFSIVIPGLIIGTENEGVANTDDFIWRLTAATIDCQRYDAGLGQRWLSIAGSDRVAALALSSLFEKTGEQSLSLSVGDGITWQDYWNFLINDCHFELQPLEHDDWSALLQRQLDEQQESHILWPVADFISKEYKPENGSGGVKDSSPTVLQQLKRTLKKNIEFLSSVGFLRNTADGNDWIREYGTESAFSRRR